MAGRMAFVLVFIFTCALMSVAQDAPLIEVPEYPIPEDNAWDYMVRAGYASYQSDAGAVYARYHLRNPEPTPDEWRIVAEAYEPAFAVLREGLYLPCRVPEVPIGPLEPVVPPEEMATPPERVVGAPAPPFAPPPPLDWVEECLASGEWTSEQLLVVSAWMRGLSRGLVCEARSRVADGRSDEALDSVQDGLRMARNLTINGTRTHQLVAGAMAAIATSSLDHVLASGDPSPERLIEFARWNEQNRAEMQPLSATVALECKRHQRWIQEVVVPTEDEYTAEVMAWLDRPAHSRGALHDPPWEGQQLTLGSTGTWPRMAMKRMLSDAGLSGMSLRCALQAYRQREGAYPTDLHALTPDYLAEVPLDPCSGEAFVYVLTPPDGTGDYSLHSVGPDGVDDHGELVFNAKDGEGDVLIAPRWDTHENR